MATFDLEYTICQIQSGAFSMAAKSHRQEGGNPQLEIDVSGSGVVWRLVNLDHGLPEVIPGQARVDRVDFYFVHDQLRALRPALPAARTAHDPALRLAPVTSQGTERREGKRVRIVAPICRFQPVQRVTVQNRTPPAFDARAQDTVLHLDFETGPKRIYGREIFEVHFGIEASYAIQASGGPGPSRAIIEMTNELYATILRELAHSI